MQRELSRAAAPDAERVGREGMEAKGLILRDEDFGFTLMDFTFVFDEMGSE